MRNLAFLTAIGGKFWKSYFQDLVVLLRSMTRIAPDDKTPVVIATDGQMSDECFAFLIEQRAAVELWQTPLDLYAKYGRTDPRYMLFEAWNPNAVDAKKAVVLGADMIFLKPWSYFSLADGPIRAWREPARGCWNSGLLMITEPLICAKERNALLMASSEGQFGKDQAVINARYKAIKPHPMWVQEFNDNGGYDRDTMVIHYIHKYYAAQSRITPFYKRLYEQFLTEKELKTARAPGFDFWCEVLKYGTSARL